MVSVSHLCLYLMSQVLFLSLSSLSPVFSQSERPSLCFIRSRTLFLAARKCSYHVYCSLYKLLTSFYLCPADPFICFIFFSTRFPCFCHWQLTSIMDFRSPRIIDNITILIENMAIFTNFRIWTHNGFHNLITVTAISSEPESSKLKHIRDSVTHLWDFDRHLPLTTLA